MKRIAIFTLVLGFLGGLISIIKFGSGSSSTGVTVRFLGMTNDPDLGLSAVLSISNGLERSIRFANPLVAWKQSQGWIASAQPVHWKLAASINTVQVGSSTGRGYAYAVESARTNVAGTAMWGYANTNRESTVIVAQPSSKPTWRVSFAGERFPGILPGIVAKLDQITGRKFHARFLNLFDGGGFSTMSPEIHEGTPVQ